MHHLSSGNSALLAPSAQALKVTSDVQEDRMTDVSSAPAPQTAPPPDPPAVKQVVITTGTIWRAVGDHPGHP